MNLSKDQKNGLRLLREFVGQVSTRVFILRGPAGSGKTTILSELIADSENKFILCATTGRAAKVMSYCVRSEATTVHKRLFNVSVQDGLPRFKNKDEWVEGVYIIDEASMLQNEQDESLLEAQSMIGIIIQRIKDSEGSKVIFVGDPYQLEPVGEKESVALSIEALTRHYEVSAMSAELEIVHRHNACSGILNLATSIRHRHKGWTLNDFEPTEDVKKISRTILLQRLRQEVECNTFHRVKYIVATNRTANEMNYLIRSQIQGFPTDLSVNDRLLVVQNNTFYTGKGTAMIANGEDCRVVELLGVVESIGGGIVDGKAYEPYLFQDGVIEVKTLDGQFKQKRVKLLLNPMFSSTSNLNPFEERRFYSFFARRNPKGAIYNPYYRALRVKYGYVLTGHKAQGGEWEVVFVDVADWEVSPFGYRWLYTAVTRPRTKLYLVMD